MGSQRVRHDWATSTFINSVGFSLQGARHPQTSPHSVPTPFLTRGGTWGKTSPQFSLLFEGCAAPVPSARWRGWRWARLPRVFCQQCGWRGVGQGLEHSSSGPGKASGAVREPFWSSRATADSWVHGPFVEGQGSEPVWLVSLTSCALIPQELAFQD